MVQWVERSGIGFQTLGRWVGFLATIFPVIGPALIGIIAAFQALSAAATGIRTLASAFGWLAKVLGLNIQISQSLRTIWTVLRAESSLLRTGLGLLARAATALWGVIAAHPIVALIVAIAALVTWLYFVTDGFRNWQGAVDALRNAFNTLIGVLKIVWDWICKIAGAIASGILGGIGRVAGGVLTYLSLIHI